MFENAKTEYRLPYRNHNTYCYPWFKKKLAGKIIIPDVGCGDGTLAAYLSEEGRTVTGIDASAEMISIAEKTVPVPVRGSSLCAPLKNSKRSQQTC